jgi:hypothetical protein
MARSNFAHLSPAKMRIKIMGPAYGRRVSKGRSPWPAGAGWSGTTLRKNTGKMNVKLRILWQEGMRKSELQS